MQYRGVNELRRLYLDFFESKGHLKMKSFSLVPHNDNWLPKQFKHRKGGQIKKEIL